MTSVSVPKSVTIIGASVCGLALSLALYKHGIPSRIFELRDKYYTFGGALSLTPNALRILELLDAYSSVKSKGWDFEKMTFITDPERTITGELYFGQKDVYGYDGLRISRNVLIHELTDLAIEAGVQIHYGKKFTNIVHEDSSGVHFEFADGTRDQAELLIATDGIHSKVRSYLFPDLVPHYSGVVGATYCFPRANVQWEKDFPLPVSLRGKQGTFMITPQNEGGKEIFVGRQCKYEQTDRAGWDALSKDEQQLHDLIKGDAAAWTPLVQDIQAQISTPDAHFVNAWPFHTIPKLDRWHSSTGRVMMLGDAAHAIPPSAGQGANQAFEDSYSFAMLLANLDDKVSFLDALKVWEAYRMQRMDDVLRLTNRLLCLRMTEEERAQIPEDLRWELDGRDAGKSQLGWLYLVDIVRDTEGVLKTLKAQSLKS